MSRRAPFAAAAATLVAFVVLAWPNITGNSPTFDETAHLAAGYSYLIANDYRLNVEHPPLIKKLAAAPLLFMRVWPANDRNAGSLSLRRLESAWSLAVEDPLAEWYFAHRLLYPVRDAKAALPTTAPLQKGDFLNDVDAMFTRARLMMLLPAIVALAIVFAWSSELWGPWGGVLSLMLLALDPNFLAHGTLVTTDVPLAAAMIGAVYFFWRWCRGNRTADAIAFAAFFAIAQVVKFSAMFLIPMVILCALVDRDARRRPGRTALAIAGALLGAYAAIWAAYGFRFSVADSPRVRMPLEETVRLHAARRAAYQRQPEGPVLESEIAEAARTARTDLPGRMLLACSRARVLPEAYLQGIAFVRNNSLVRNAYLRGEHSVRGFRSFFFWTFLYKTPPAAIALILAALALGFRRFPSALLVPLIVYLAISVASSLSIGHRHILPVYPFLYISAGFLTLLAGPRRVPIGAGIAAILLATALASWGRHLSYTNALSNGWRDLADSNFDWGQDLHRLGRWLRDHDVREPINLVYFGTADPRYSGVPFVNLEQGHFAFPEQPPRVPGLLAISATRLAGATTTGPRRHFWRDYLRQHGARQVGTAGNTIFIYRLDR